MTTWLLEKREVTRVALEIPKVGLVMESARLIRWLKNVGEVVTQGEPLVELETEKSVVEIESTESGRLVEKPVCQIREKDLSSREKKSPDTKHSAKVELAGDPRDRANA